ncbi:MAG: transposase [Clostridiales bacterium]|nr:transposase [Clostridiales bacterium]
MALWRKKEIQRIVEHNAHRNGMRVSHICAWGTSKLAFDGGGKVERGKYTIDGQEKYNYSICVFPNGKTYHSDLNASYNIGARYFVREILKSDPATVRLPDEAKAPLWHGNNAHLIYVN